MQIFIFSGYCSLGGDSQFHTFDGSYYTIPAPTSPGCGSRTLITSSDKIRDPASKFTVSYSAVPCSDDVTAACITSIKIEMGEMIYLFSPDLTVSFGFFFLIIDLIGNKLLV